ncbi:MAG: SpoIID/LytB domain-containing protein, partial [Anaerolineales bacterium]
MRSKPIHALITLALIATGLLSVGIDRGTQAAGNAHLEGVVRDENTGTPIRGATIRLPDLGLSAVSGTDGRFTVPDISISEEYIVTNVVISADGYGDWRIEGVRLVQVDTLILTAELGPSPKTIQVPPPRLERPPEDQPLISGAMGDLTAEDQTDEPLPATIDVRVTGDPYCDLDNEYTVETIDFKEYVKHVLPNEWSASWPGESLRAGAMAAKMYAWSIVAAGGKWSDADVYDSTCDQVYNPSIEYQSTNDAVDFTWNWRQTWSSDGSLVRAYYRAYYSQCQDAGLDNRCMGQNESRDMAYDRYSWDEILDEFYVGSQLNEVWDPPGGYSLRYEGNGYGDLDRVKILLDDPARPVDVGTTDFTLEWWMKARPGENGGTSCTTAADAWRGGNILIDRDVFGPGDHGEYGVSLMNGRLAFGAHNGSQGITACGSTNVADDSWHHVAVQRTFSDGGLAIYVDGSLDGAIVGPTGDLTYRDGRTPLNSCGSDGDQPCSKDPYLVLGAEKHDQDNDLYPSFLGWIDELRVSDILRYDDSFATPSGPFSPDGNTMALYHFDRGFGNDISDSSGASGGPSDGYRRYGGVINGPEWTLDSPWYVP